jgi:hypothetical protein
MNMGIWTVMMKQHSKAALMVAALVLAVCGCDRSVIEARKQVLIEKSVEQLSGLKDGELEQFRTNLVFLKLSLNSLDFTKAREASQQIDGMLNQRVLTWYVDTLRVEEKEGVAAAREHIVKLKQEEAKNDPERKALGYFESYIIAKGDLKTTEALEMALRIYLAAKFGSPHGKL